MEKSSLENFSSYTRVCQSFIEACRTEKVDPANALLSIARFLGVPIGTPVSPSTAATATSASVQSVPPDPSKVSLTKEQAEEARKEARAAKAKRLGLSPNEVNLTPKEAKDAKAEMRMRVAGRAPGSVIPTLSTPPATSSIPQQKTGSVVKLTTDGAKALQALSLRSGSQVHGRSRATAKTRLDNFRRNCLRTAPQSLVEPVILNLVAYWNHFVRLSRQWDEFKDQYSDYGLLNPLRDLPNPLLLPETKKILVKDVFPLLREQSDSPGTYALQSDTGASYWDRDRPGPACPDFLVKPIPPNVLLEFETASGAVNA
jgi:hypothetical protein